MLHIGCNISTNDLPDMYALSPELRSVVLRLWAHISGKLFDTDAHVTIFSDWKTDQTNEG